MARKGHGRVLNKDSSGPPTRPDRAYRRVQNGYSNSSDQKDINAYVKADESFKTHCEIVFASAKRAIGNSIRSYLDTVMDSMDDGSYKNILRMFRHLRKKYGGWTDQKGQRNYYAIIAIPKFDSFESVFSGLKELKYLMDERKSWNLPEQLYKDTFYRSWLINHIDTWPILNFLFHTIAGQCPKRFIDSCATLAYQTFVSVLLWVGLAITNTISAPVTTRLVTNAAVSHEEYMRRNPKWRKAILGPESDKWKIADDAERDQQLKRQPGKDGPHMVELLGGKSDVPKGMPIFPIKRVCKIKSNDIHLIYHFFLVWKTTQLMLWISHLSQRILLG